MFDFFTSDHHFGHRNIIQYCDRPYRDVYEMDRDMIARWNARVPRTASVCVVGDFSFHSPTRTRDILATLHGTKTLVAGNHDPGAYPALGLGFDLVAERQLYTWLVDREVLVCHYPARRQDTAHDARYIDRRPVLREGEVLIHGHTHSEYKRDGPCIHVGVDAWDFAPVSTGEIVDLLDLCLPPA